MKEPGVSDTRDRAIDRLLRQPGMLTPEAGPRSDCLDGETMAAWADGALARQETHAVETHLAACGRCQALLATYARTLPAHPVHESLWRRWHLRWLVPLSAVATLAGLWLLSPVDQTTEPTADLMARLEAPASPPQEAPPSTARQRQAAAPAAIAQPPAAPTEPSVPSAGLSGGARPDTRAQNQLGRLESDAIEPESRALERAAEAPAPGPATEAFRQPARVDGAATAAAAPAAARLAEVVAGLEIPTPDPQVRWRLAGNRIERTTSGGAQWTTVGALAEERLVAGSAPSATVCWLVGAGGAVYVSVDGARLDQVPAPAPADLTEVLATDGESATVGAADGRAWRTADRGRSWTPVP